MTRCCFGQLLRGEGLLWINCCSARAGWIVVPLLRDSHVSFCGWDYALLLLGQLSELTYCSAQSVFQLLLAELLFSFSGLNCCPAELLRVEVLSSVFGFSVALFSFWKWVLLSCSVVKCCSNAAGWSVAQVNIFGLKCSFAATVRSVAKVCYGSKYCELLRGEVMLCCC